MAEGLYHRTGMNVGCSVPDVNLGSFHVSGDDCRSEVYSTRVLACAGCCKTSKRYVHSHPSIILGPMRAWCPRARREIGIVDMRGIRAIRVGNMSGIL